MGCIVIDFNVLGACIAAKDNACFLELVRDGLEYLGPVLNFCLMNEYCWVSINLRDGGKELEWLSGLCELCDDGVIIVIFGDCVGSIVRGHNNINAGGFYRDKI